MSLDDDCIVISTSGGRIAVTPTAPQPVTVSPTGRRGASAYETWLAQGHLGSEADFLAWLQVGSGSGGGIQFPLDKELPCLITISDGDPAIGSGLSADPDPTAALWCEINGVDCGHIGDGTKEAPMYFSRDGGVTALARSDLRQGDVPRWNGSIAGYKLDGSDRLSIFYET